METREVCSTYEPQEYLGKFRGGLANTLPELAVARKVPKAPRSKALLTQKHCKITSFAEIMLCISNSLKMSTLLGHFGDPRSVHNFESSSQRGIVVVTCCWGLVFPNEILPRLLAWHLAKAIPRRTALFSTHFGFPLVEADHLIVNAML